MTLFRDQAAAAQEMLDFDSMRLSAARKSYTAVALIGGK